MAKTKRRQLAALAEQAALKELLSRNGGSFSGTIPKAGDPNVEIRTQRVIIKIPALPPKPSAAVKSPEIAKKESLGKGRRKRSQIDVNQTAEQVPADEAKISKGIAKFGRWKRHKRIGDLITIGAKAVTPSAGLSNGGQQPSPVPKSMVSDKPPNGSQGPSKTSVKLTTGPRKRTKLQEVAVRSPASEKQSKLLKNRGAKLHGVVGRSPDENGSKLRETQGNGKETKQRTKDKERLHELARAPDGDSPTTLAHSPVTKKRRGGNVKKAILEAPGGPKATVVVSPHRTRSKAKISNGEALALEVLQEIRNVKNISQRTQTPGKIAAKGRLLGSSTGDRGGIDTARDQSQEPQTSGNSTSPVGRDEQLGRDGGAADSSSHGLFPSGRHTSRHTCSRGGPPGGSKLQSQKGELQIPSAPDEQGFGLAVRKQGKDVGQSTAEILKQNSRLSTYHAEAVGGNKRASELALG